MTVETFTATVTDEVTGLTGTKSANFTVGTAPAPFPSVLRTSGQNIVDSNGYVMPFMPGFCVPVYESAAPFSAQEFVDMYNKGARIVRVMTYWDQLEPSKGAIATSWVQSHLDVTIQRAVAAGLYVWLGYYFGPNGTHMPSWAQTTTPASCMANYVTNGQNATQYLAQRYGDPSDPLGAGQYTPAVIGMGINEPTPDYTNQNNWVVNIVTEQVQMATWMRVYAPAWILSLSFGFGGTAPYANAPGSGQTAQTFTSAPKAPTTNFWADHHNYFWNTDEPSNPNWDGRNANGSNSSTHDLQRQNSPTYPPIVGGVTLTEAEVAAMNEAYLAAYVAYCSPAYADCPLFIGEYGWDAVLNGTTGIAQNVSDKLEAWQDANACGWTQWDYATNQSSDSMCARPGVGKPGADTDGWQIWTNTMFANF